MKHGAAPELVAVGTGLLFEDVDTKMIVFLRSNNLAPDPRVQKYIDFLKSQSDSFFVIGWDRDGKKESTDKYFFYRRKASFGAGFKNIIFLIYWNFYILRKLFFLRKKIDVIHACDYDTVLPALIIKFFLKKKIIYDIFDWYSDSRMINSRYLKNIINKSEIFAVKRADYVIICDESRKKQIQYSPKNLLILPNIPVMSNSFLPNEYHSQFDRIKLSYVGILSRYRNLEWILDIVSKNKYFEFSIAGFGELEQYIKKIAALNSNIIYHGIVQYEKGLALSNNSDIMLAMYNKCVPNHIVAAPNKYYEGLFLGRPILTTKGIAVGDKTEKHDTGFVVNDDYVEIENLLKDKNLLSISQKKAKKAKELWEKRYKVYINDFMNNEYLPIIAGRKNV